MSLFWAGDRTPGEVTQSAEISLAGSLVGNRFDAASDYAKSLWGIAEGLLAALGSVAYPIDWSPVDIESVDPGGLDGVSASEPPDPSINPIVVAPVTFEGEVPEPVTITLPVRSTPVPNITDPDFEIPDSPDVTWPIFTAEPPSISNPEIPGAPTINLPPAPQLPELSIPSPPEYNIPDFNWELPTDDLTPPEPQFVWNEAEYDSALKQILADRLYSNIIAGGSGLPVATEQGIYDRAVSRQLDEEQLVLEQTLDFFASRLYELPPGALSNQMLEMNNKVLKTREDLNRDILVQQSTLVQKNTHFIITSAIQSEKDLMANTNQFQARALDAAKFVVQSALLIYQVKVEAYKARLAVYAAQVEVYKAKIAGELGKAEFYKAQMEGVKASAEVQKAIADIYASQVNAARIYIELYKAEMEGAAIKAQIDEVRIRGFAAMVQAYSAQVVAASERYRGYESQIKGEVAKADLYKAQVQGYATMVEAYKSEIQADTMVLAQELEKNKNKVEIFKVQLEKYSADVKYAVADADIQSRAEGLKVDVFKALAANYGMELNALVNVYNGKVEYAKAQAEIEIKEADIIVREALGRYELILKSMTSAAQIASQMAAAAISGVSASANIQHGESRSDSRSASVSESYIAQDIKQQSVSWQNIWTHEE